MCDQNTECLLTTTVSMKNALRIKRKEERKWNFEEEKKYSLWSCVGMVVGHIFEMWCCELLYFSMGFNWSSLTIHLSGPAVYDDDDAWTIQFIKTQRKDLNLCLISFPKHILLQLQQKQSCTKRPKMSIWTLYSSVVQSNWSIFRTRQFIDPFLWLWLVAIAIHKAMLKWNDTELGGGVNGV